MNPEKYAWMALEEHAANQLRPGFAQRTVAAARHVAPTLASQVLISLATAAVCLTAIYMVDTHLTNLETARNLAGWQQVAAEAEYLGQL